MKVQDQIVPNGFGNKTDKSYPPALSSNL